ncbi:hypothetical protein [Streptomyces sp. NPDC058086]|uniref:hypothetical protein n=1 Tax=Streptomyces sp. NPDC058086 TaxID=3346334 RepID=UPI0036F0296C
MRQLIAERERLTVFLLPAHSPDLDPVEGVWAHVKRSRATSPLSPSTAWGRSSATGSNASRTGPRSSTASSPEPAWPSTTRRHPDEPKSGKRGPHQWSSDCPGGPVGVDRTRAPGANLEKRSAGVVSRGCLDASPDTMERS